MTRISEKTKVAVRTCRKAELLQTKLCTEKKNWYIMSVN